LYNQKGALGPSKEFHFVIPSVHYPQHWLNAAYGISIDLLANE
jgi:hypothetical protein